MHDHPPLPEHPPVHPDTHPHTGPLAAMDGPHAHVFLGRNHDRNARRTWWVIALTAATMGAEIVAGTVFGSMALVADGWHMATHAAALMITALSYDYARRHAHDPRFSFGTGKIGDLAAFTSAVVLALVALLIGWESLQRLAQPVPIDFAQATLVAVLGLAVNLASALLLHEGGDHGHDHAPHSHDHGHDHAHSHAHHHAHGHDAAQDSNLRAAYLHVLADALTSVMAIAALVLGRAFGWSWLDPMIGLIGALVIARWSWGLMQQAGGVLVDRLPEGTTLPEQIRAALEDGAVRITDLHVWQLGPGRHGAIVALETPGPGCPSCYRARLAHLGALAHVTIEVRPVLTATA